MKIPVLVIGGGLSGLAAAIRIARFSPEVLLLEQHSRLGGLNSYFYRNKILHETGLHAITNYAVPGDKKAPLNRLLRQLKLRRKDIELCQQNHSKIVFKNRESLRFSNDLNLLESEIAVKFPHAAGNFRKLLIFLDEYDAFTPAPFKSAKTVLFDLLKDKLLTEMLLCPLMFYGSSQEDDIDLSQFAILFRAIFIEGMCRPQGTIKDFLDLLVQHLEDFGGKIRKNSRVEKIIPGNKYSKVLLSSGEELDCEFVLSTIGYPETLNLFETESTLEAEAVTRLGFLETIYCLDKEKEFAQAEDATIIFYNNRDSFSFRLPDEPADFSSGVICFPSHFKGVDDRPIFEIRSTHLANYAHWKDLSSSRDAYEIQKQLSSFESLQKIEKIVGNFRSDVTFHNTFTPITIERYTSKIEGAIYGSPIKVKDGVLGYNNIYLAGTDQGFLGIIGSMLSGVSIVNQHILPKL